MAKRGFEQGRSTFTCKCCNRRTRETTQGDAEYCAECYDLFGYQNILWDDGKLTSEYIAQRNGLLGRIIALGGDGERVKAKMRDLFAV